MAPLEIDLKLTVNGGLQVAVNGEFTYCNPLTDVVLKLPPGFLMSSEEYRFDGPVGRRIYLRYQGSGKVE